jgi:hypothetical protein
MVAHGCAAILALCAAPDDSNRRRQRAADASAVPALVSVLRAHPAAKAPELHSVGTKALTLVCFKESLRAAAAAAGAKPEWCEPPEQDEAQKVVQHL